MADEENVTEEIAPEETTGGVAEETGEEETSSPGETETEEEKPVTVPLKALEEERRKRQEERRKAEYWERVATEGKKPVEQTPAVVDPGKPKVEQFEDYDAYVEALTDWKLEQRERVAEQRKIEAQRSQNAASHQERASKAKEVYQDFEEVLDSARDILFQQSTLDAIVESDHSADIIYYLGKNKDQAQKISSMPIHRQLIEIGKIETRFEKKDEPSPTKRVTKAPDPISPVGNRDKTITNLHDIKDDNEWHRREQERLKKLGRLY